MISLYDYIINSLNENRVISFGTSSSSYGECIILAGGPGSGKGFTSSKINASFKTLDVDELKKQYIKLLDKGKIKDEYKEFNLRDPKDVGELHMRVKKHGWKNKKEDLIFKDKFDKNNPDKEANKSNIKSNLLFDKVCGEPDDISDIAVRAKALGYKVTVVWVLCNLETAKINNQIRDRIVGEKDVLIPNHKAAYDTMTGLFNNKFLKINEYIDKAWLGYSAGFGRKLSGKYASSPCLPLEKDDKGNFIFNQKEMVDNFLKEQQPIDYEELHNNLVDKKVKKSRKDSTLKFIELEHLDLDKIQKGEIKE